MHYTYGVKVAELNGDIDKVVYLASLSSNPVALNPILNKLRAMTAQLPRASDVSVDPTLLSILKKSCEGGL